MAGAENVKVAGRWGVLSGRVIAVQGVALLLLGSVLLYFFVSARIMRYLQDAFLPFALGGGVVLTALGFFLLVTLRWRPSGSGVVDGDSMAWWMPWVFVMVPMGMSLVYTKDTYSMRAIMAKGVDMQAGGMVEMERVYYTRQALSAPVEERYQQTEGGGYLIPMEEIFYSAMDPAVRKRFEGLPVEVVARIRLMEENNPEGRRMRLFRMLVTCCAADARAVGVTAEMRSVVPDWPEGGWVLGRGAIGYEEVGGQVVPLLELESLDRVAPPADAW